MNSKNRSFTGFATGGKEGAFGGAELPEDRTLVLCESAIDALSHAVLFPDHHARYASIGGQVNPAQPELIRHAAAGMPRDAVIMAAMDADEAGRGLAEMVQEAVGLTKREDLRFVHHEPVGFKDWNDQLRNRPQVVASGGVQGPSVA